MNTERPINSIFSEREVPLPRCIPQREKWSQLIPALTAGEISLACKLDDELPEGWCIAVQRKLNNAVPDVLCFHPEHGIIIFEVKDWDPDAREFRVKGSNIWARNVSNDTSYVTDDPAGQVMHYKDILAETFPRFTDAEIMITTVVVLTKFTDEAASALIDQLRPSIYRKKSHRPYFLVVGRETLARHASEWLIVVSRQPNMSLEEFRRGMVLSPRVAERMMWILRVPELELERYQPLSLDAQKRDFLRNPNRATHRKVRGAVGSGKSTLLAARAAQAVAEGQKVLTVTFTISLRQWLHRLIVRAGIQNERLEQAEFSQRTKELVWIWYVHEFARAIANAAGRGTEFNRLIGSTKQYPEQKILDFVRPLVDLERVKRKHTYDLVLVDEMQNVDREWLEIFDKCVAENGEIVIFGDPAQNVYKRDLSWTTAAVPGFPGRWNDLKGSYRFPPAMYPMLKDFYETFDIKGHESEEPSLAGEALFDAVELVWYKADQDNKYVIAAEQVRNSDHLGVAAMDTAFLAMRHADGMAVLRELSGMDRPPQEVPGFVHVFSHDPENTAHLKKAFWPMRGEKKLCTVHSFQGWEARYVVLLIGPEFEVHDGKDTFDYLRTVYVGLSRLARSEHASRIVVVNAERKLDEFFSRHFTTGD